MKVIVGQFTIHGLFGYDINDLKKLDLRRPGAAHVAGVVQGCLWHFAAF